MTTRLEETRRRVQTRLVEIGEAADREVTRAQRLRDAAITVLGVVGLLFATHKVAKAIAAKTGTKAGKPTLRSGKKKRAD